MKKKITLSVNSEFNVTSFKNKSINLISAESNNNKGITYLLKTEKSKCNIIFHLNQCQNKELNNIIDITSSTKIELISDIDNHENDSILLFYEIVESEINNFSNNKEFENESVEDEEFNEDYENEEFEEDISLVEESDIEQIANDLWDECEEEFGESENFLNKKRKI